MEAKEVLRGAGAGRWDGMGWDNVMSSEKDVFILFYFI